MLFFGKVKRQKLLSFGLVLATLAIGIVLGTFVNRSVRASHQSQSGVAPAPDAAPLVIPAAAPVANDFTRLTKRVEPSVVYIESEYLAKTSSGKRGRRGTDNDGSSDDDTPDATPRRNDPSDMFRRFFGQDQPRSFRSEGSGTGFIVDKNGYIITNQHVVDKADRIKVRLSGDQDRTEYRGRVIGFDKETDLAVIKIDAGRPLTPVQIGNSDSVQVGDWVIAIGSPFGLQATVTAGIISAQRTSRDLPGAGEFQNFIQTDAAINPGNSGGPLLNVRGEVIGVNTMIATHSGSYEGIGFALPSNMAVRVYNEIIRTGHVTRGSIGVRWARDEHQSDTLHAFGLTHGVLVESVAPAGPAGRAGIKPDDVIVAMNEKPIRDGQELVTKIADLPIGSTVLFTVDRDGKKLDFKVPIEERAKVWSDQPQFSSNVPPPAPAPSPKESLAPGRFGISIMRLTPKERKELELDANDGVKVASVDPGSFAEDIGVQEGDAIISINRHSVKSPDDVMRMQATLKPGQPVAVHIVRGGRRAQPQRYYLSGRLPEP